LEERVFSQPAVKDVLKRFVCVRLDRQESVENRALKIEYGPVVLGNVQNRIVSPSGENLARLPANFDTADLVEYLKEWLAFYPGEKKPPANDCPLPYFATLHQALNVAACDARVLVVVMGRNPEVEDLLKPLAWDPEFAGRLHFVRARANDEPLGRIHGLEAAADGAYLVVPHEFGMKGELAGRLGLDMTRDDVLETARTTLRKYAAEFEPRTFVQKFQRHSECSEREWFYPTTNRRPPRRRGYGKAQSREAAS
jgi:hypothetical protein